MDLVQMMLRCGLSHELPDAFIELSVDYLIVARAEGSAYAFVIERGPFSESCRRIEIDLGFLVGHV